MKRKILAIMMAMIIVLTTTACGILEQPNGLNPTVEPTITTTPGTRPTPTVSNVLPVDDPDDIVKLDESTQWGRRYLNGVIDDETIVSTKHLTRVIYPVIDGDMSDPEVVRVVGYLKDDSQTVKKLKGLCEEYVRVSLNFDYKTVIGKEEWYLFHTEQLDYYIKNKGDEYKREMAKKYEAISESLGILEYLDIVIDINGTVAYVSFTCLLKETGTPEYMDTLTLNDKGETILPMTLVFEIQDNSYKILKRFSEDKQIPFKEFSNIQ